MGAESSKAKDFKNIDAEDIKRFTETFKAATNGKDKIYRDQFINTYSPIIGDFANQFFLRLIKREPTGILHLRTLLKCVDGGLGAFDSQASTLKTCFGDTKEQIMRNTVKIYCEANGMSREDQVRLYEYFEAENKQDVEHLANFFSECPLFPYCSAFIFNKLAGRPGDPKIPTISTKSEIIGKVDLLVLNSHLPFDRRKNWTLLYQMSSHGQSFSQMVKRINGEGPCLVAIRSAKGRRFGFFANCGFQSGPQYHGSAECFLFSLSPRVQVFAATGRTENYAYLNFQQQSLPNGLGLSGQDDVWPILLREEFGTGICQKNSRFYEPCFIAEEEEFKIKMLEVWRPGDKPQKTFEEEMEPKTEKSIIDKDPQAKAVLELAGKTMHSDAYRDPAPLLAEE